MTVLTRLSLAFAALAFTAGAASAQCAYSSMKMASTPPPAAEASEVDVAALVPPALPADTRAEADAPDTSAK